MIVSSFTPLVRSRRIWRACIVPLSGSCLSHNWVSKNIDCTDLSASDRFFGLIIQKCVSNTNFMPAIDKHDCQLIHAPRQKSSYLEGLYCSPLRLLVSQTITAHAPSSQVS